MKELTILLPCLNEADSLEFCIFEARAFLEKAGIDGEVLVSDNGSTDGSRELAKKAGARVTDAPTRGYGAALRHGIFAAEGRYVIMADADGSYMLDDLLPFVEALRSGYALVVGDRYAKGFERGASPWLHRCIGVPMLSALGRLAAGKLGGRTKIHDFHCGLRGVGRAEFIALGTRTTGMEFASEMILAATAAGQRICELPTGLRRDRRGGRRSHLRAFRDGLRHAALICKYLAGTNRRKEG